MTGRPRPAAPPRTDARTRFHGGPWHHERVTPPAPLAATELTQGCVRCGATVPLGTSMCENCNPLGLKQPAPSQAHGTVFLGVVVAVVGLAILGRLALNGIGPFQGQVGNIVAVPPGLAAGRYHPVIGAREIAAGTDLTAPADHAGISRASWEYFEVQ